MGKNASWKAGSSRNVKENGDLPVGNLHMGTYTRRNTVAQANLLEERYQDAVLSEYEYIWS